MAQASNSGVGLVETTKWSLRLFGAFCLSTVPDGDKIALPGKRERVLLAYLALAPTFRASRRRLTGLLWGDSTDETNLDNLRVCIWGLRKALGDSRHQIIASDGDDVALDAAAFDVDVLLFENLGSQSSPEKLEAALNLYTGEFLEGLGIESDEFESWKRAEVTRFRDLVINGLYRLMAQFIDAGEKERAIRTGTRILQLEPMHEATSRRLMQLYNESSRRGAAVHVYRTLAQVLKKEFNAEPEAETSRVLADITQGGKTRTSRSFDLKEMSAANPANSAHPLESSGALPPPARPFSARRSSLAIFAGVFLIATGLVFYRLPVTGVDRQPPPVAASLATSVAQSSPSIAVLPFVNLSGDPTQEFLSDGMTEEITAVFAKVADLRVVARASAFQFKGEKKDLRAVGHALGARYVVDGSVRKAGNRVRIAAELIQADNGMMLWSETYDRELTDVFAIQEDVARAIAISLRGPLGLRPDQNLVETRVIDAVSYQQFLRAKALVRDREDPAARSAALTDATALLEPIVARNPKFAPAWAQLALIYQRKPLDLQENTPLEARRRSSDQWLAKAEAASERAIELDPRAPDGYSSLGLTMAMRGRLLRAEELFAKALVLDPFYPEALHSYANLLYGVGRYKDALATRELLMSIEPLVPVYHSNIYALLWINGRAQSSVADLKTKEPLTLIAEKYAAAGHDAEAIDTLKRIPPDRFPSGMLENAVRLMRTAPTAAVSQNSLPRMSPALTFVYLHVDALDRIIQAVEGGVAAGYQPPYDMAFVWEPAFAPLRKTERFKAFARNYGLVEYWRAKGWPQECHPQDGGDFACD